MRTLIFMRGAPGVGKSSLINKYGWDTYTVSPDTIRMLVASPVHDLYGKAQISQANEDYVWKLALEIIEKRMQHGDFTVVDSTNSRAKDMRRLREMANEYRYRIFCIDMSSVPIEEAKKNNLLRPDHKHVPECDIDKMYTVIANESIPSGITPIYPVNGEISEEDMKKILFDKINLDKYEKIHVFGDIHGCYTCLRTYLKEINPNHFYIFSGDYIDRGIENVETLEFLMPLAKLDNVFFLEGNHERWLWNYAKDKPVWSHIFKNKTMPEIEKSRIKKSELRTFYRKLGQCAYFEFGGRNFTVCHGGISTLPNVYISTSEYINGVGAYEDAETVENSFFDNTSDNDYLIHGHRNITHSPIKVNDRCYNLESEIEFGGHLRVLEITKNDIIPHEIENTVYGTFDYGEIFKPLPNDIGKVVEVLKNSKFVKERGEGHISSFNFTREAFNKKKWTDATVKARGLFINTKTNEIVARGFEKFFNIEEHPTTSIESLKTSLVYPITAYVKENGFLGILGYDSETDNLVIASKSTTKGPYAKYFEKLLLEKIKEKESELKEYLKNNNKGMTFEVIDMENDPHIIEYPKSKIVLLDVMDREIKYSHIPYEELLKIGEWLNVEVKEKAFVLNDWNEFYNWYNEITKPGYKYKNNDIEGYVIEDASGFMTKIKLHYYKQWKFYRSIAATTTQFGHFRNSSSFSSPTDFLFYNFIKEQYEKAVSERKSDRDSDTEDPLYKLRNKSIIEFRKEFFEKYGNEIS